MEAAKRSADPRGDTIAAIATAPGRGALALVRVSGPAARSIAEQLGARGTLVPRRATRVLLHAPNDPHGQLDDVLVTFFPAPDSATGEDVIELSVHGGAWVSAAVLEATVAAGARPAMAGEFSERAVRNGKMDLLQAEAVADLIEARSRAMHRAAMRQLSGALTQRLDVLRGALLDVEALIAYEIDFPEEDDGPQPRARAVAASDAVLVALDALQGTLPAAELGRDGVTIVIVGAPNAGKSSLLNALAGDARAIVSDVPGTTRDAIELLVDHDPWPLRFVDTAGLRHSDDHVERLGLEVSARWLSRAHLVLVCGEDPTAVADARAAVAALSSAPQLAVMTKADLQASQKSGRMLEDAIAVSATTGSGLDALRAAIAARVRLLHPDPPEELPVITRARHFAAIQRARDEVAEFRSAWEAGALPGPVAATHLRAAVHALDELLGAIDTDEVLERVFRSFCIGK